MSSGHAAAQYRGSRADGRTRPGAAAGGYGLDDHVYQRLLRERIIFLGSEVHDQIANAICAQLLLLSAEDPDKDIYLYINSPGGSVAAGMAIYDTMQYVKNDVATVAMGLAASMGQFLLCAGAKGKRYALPHARIMMHQPSRRHRRLRRPTSRSRPSRCSTRRRRWPSCIAQHTGQPIEQIELDSDRDRWFTAEEAQGVRLRRPRGPQRRARPPARAGPAR